MDIKTKSISYIAGSLIIGILIGIFGTISYLKPPSGDRVDIRDRNSYKNKMMNIIQPTDSQKDTLSALIEKYEEKMRTRHEQTMTEYRAMRDSMKMELNQHLTEEQMQRLEQYHQERKERYQRRKANRNRDQER